MKAEQNQDCPLCDTPANFIPVDSGNVKYFDCSSCGMFQISKRAETLLLSEHASRRPAYASKAKLTPEDHLLFIRMPSHESRQKSDDALQADFTPKSDLSLS